MNHPKAIVDNNISADISRMDILESMPGFVSDSLDQIVRAQVEIASAADSVSDVMDAALNHAMVLTDSDGAAIITVRGEFLVLKASAGIAKIEVPDKISIDNPFYGSCIRQGKSIYCADRRSNDDINKLDKQDVHSQSILLVPLQFDNRVLGIVVVLSERKDAFTVHDEGRLSLITGMTATAMSHAATSEVKSRLLLERSEALRELQESQYLYRTSLDAVQEGYIVHDRRGVMVSLNARAEEILGTDLVGKTHQSRNFYFIDEDDKRVISSDLPRSRALRTCVPESAILGVVTEGKCYQWLSMSACPLFHYGENEPYATVTTFYDITARRDAEVNLRRSEERLQEAQRLAGIGSWELDIDSQSYWLSEQFFRILGMDPWDKAPGIDVLRSFFHPDDVLLRDNAMSLAISDGQSFEFDIRILPNDVAIKWCHLRGHATIDSSGKTSKVSGTMTDITDRKLIEEELREHVEALAQRKEELESANSLMDRANQRLQLLAIEDGMTGLKNHRAFQEKLSYEVEMANRYGVDLSMIMLDVDHFKSYNDTYGHPEGDTILKNLAEILKHSCRGTDSAARYGGEEFALILPHTDSDGALIIAERIRSSVTDASWCNRQVTVSIGVATLHKTSDTAGELIGRADKALYESKRRGRNCVTGSNQAG